MARSSECTEQYAQKVLDRGPHCQRRLVTVLMAVGSHSGVPRRNKGAETIIHATVYSSWRESDPQSGYCVRANLWRIDRWGPTMRYSAIAALLMVALAAAAQVSAPSADPAQGTVWDLTVIYPNDAAAERERLAIIAELPSLAAFKGHLGDNAATLRKALDQRSKLMQRARRVSSYAALKVAEDARVGSSQALLTSAGDLMDQLGSASSFYDPEIIAIGRARIAAFEAAEPGLDRHRHALELYCAAPTTCSRRRPKRPSQRPVRSPIGIEHTRRLHKWRNALACDQGSGKSTQLTPEAYREVLVDPDRDTRRAAFETFTGALGAFRNTQAALLQAHVDGAAYEAKLRHYSSSVAFLLADDAMPDGCFDALSRAAQGEQPVIDHYLRLRAQALGLADPHTYDLTVPLAGRMRTFSLAEGEAVVLKALAPLGHDYVDQLSEGFHARRMHAIAAPGKSPGASTDPVDDSMAPFVLLTYTGDAKAFRRLRTNGGTRCIWTWRARRSPSKPQTSRFSSEILLPC